MSASLSPPGENLVELTPDSPPNSANMETAQDLGTFEVDISNSNTNMSANQWTALEPSDFIMSHDPYINSNCSCGCCVDEAGETKADLPDTNCEELNSQANSVHSDTSLPSSHKSLKPSVHMSKCKSSTMQQHLAKIMGCRASSVAKKRALSARIQYSPQIQESSTQCATKKFSELSIQTSSERFHTMSVQTSPILFKVDASTDFPEKVVVSTRKKGITRKMKEPTERKASSQNISVSHDSQSKHPTTTESEMKAALNSKLDFQKSAKSKIGSLDNAAHRPLGGDSKVYQRKLTFRETASSKIGSLDNIRHKPGGGDKQIVYQVVAKRPIPISSMSTFGDSNFLFLPKARENKWQRSRSEENTITRTAWSDCTEPITTVTHGNASSAHQLNVKHVRGTRSSNV